MTAVPDAPPATVPPDVAPSDTAPGPLVPDRIEIEVPRGARVIVISDQHLGNRPTEAATAATTELAAALKSIEGPGLLVIAGDGFEMLACPPDIAAILDAHPDFESAVAAFAKGKGHRVVVLPGNHDGQLAWDPVAVATVKERLGATGVTLSCDLLLDTGAGIERVHIVHGNQDDPYNAFVDPRAPLDTPLGHHVVRQVLPQITPRQKPGSLLQDITWLNDTDQLADFVGSRLLYRKVVGRLWWLAVPFAAALALRFIAFVPGVDDLLRHHAERWLIGLGIALVLVLVVTAVASLATMLRVNRELAASAVSERSGPVGHNAAARQRAAKLIADGYAGLVSGHTHEPELSVVGMGFYANSGCGVESVLAHRTWLDLPRTFLPVRRCSRVELIAGAVLEVRLVTGDTPERSPVFLERVATRPDPRQPAHPTLVASLPYGGTWPIAVGRTGAWNRRRLIRRVAAGLLALSGVLHIVSAFVRDLREVDLVDRVAPFTAHPVAGVGAVLCGLALLGLAHGVRRGYRSALVVAVVLLATGALAHLVKGNHFEEALMGAFLAAWLVFERRHFRVGPPGRTRFLVWAISLAVLGVALAIGLGLVLDDPDERLARTTIALVVGGMVLLAFLIAKPGRRRAGDRAPAMARARDIIRRHGSGTLDYFALRDDKDWLFSGDTVVAYGVVNRVMLVSPDPIGPSSERVDAWADAMDFADANGWSIAVLAAGPSWLPIYRSAGLTDTYIGDEATVYCDRFSLQGKSMKSLRGAYNRMAKGGYRVEMLDPATIDPDLKAKLLSLMTETRQGEAERGFSMTLSRIFDPNDTGLLLSVCFDSDGNPKAFNQYVPAAAINGYSLDVMRRTADPDAPNGLTDFVIIETLNWMKERHLGGLGLNFATMRAVLAGEFGTGPWRTLERKTLHHFSDTMQIESLWKFNQKYDPEWTPRYVVTDSAVSIPREALAMARVESVTELPVIGKLLEPRGPDPASRQPEHSA